MYNRVLTNILTKQHAGMLGWPWLVACPCALMGASSWLFMHHLSQIFWQQSHKADSQMDYTKGLDECVGRLQRRLWPSENTGIMLKSVIHSLSHYTHVLMCITFYVVPKTMENFMLAVTLSKHLVLYISILRMEMMWTTAVAVEIQI